jgi:pyruvate kinase
MEQGFLKRTKIVATIGPATESSEMLSVLMKAGLNVCRLNMSHGNHSEHKSRIKTIRTQSVKDGIRVAILQDLSGPKIRIGDFDTETITLLPGNFFTLTTKKIIGSEKKVSVSYSKLPKEVKKGMYLMLNDGRQKLEVVKVDGDEIKTKIIIGGVIKGRRGVNVPGAYLSLSSITEKDREDIVFGMKENVDMMALSFVRTPEDVLALRDILKKGKKDIAIISKIETQEAVDNIDEIIRLSDAVMVARGDLAIEIGASHVPVVQKMIIKKCNAMGVPVIVATQMLESMISSPVPTRAEVSDIANSIFDGTDAIMLSEETTLGKFPVEAVTVMTHVAQEVEASMYADGFFRSKDSLDDSSADAVSHSVVCTARDLNAKAIIALTQSGGTARLITRHKSPQYVLACSPHERVLNRLMLSFGCVPVLIPELKNLESALSVVKKEVKKIMNLKNGDVVIVSAGVPFGKPGSTNMMIVETI